MQGLTWRDLMSPVCVMTFLRGFLLAALPALGLGNAVEGAGMIDVTVMPSLPVIFGVFGLGLLGGIQSLRDLITPAPIPRNSPPVGGNLPGVP